MPFDELKAEAFPDTPDIVLMLLVPTALAGVLAVARLIRSKYVDSFEHLSSSYDQPSLSSQMGTLGSITLALVQLLMYGAFLNRFASAGTDLTVPWFNDAVVGQAANYCFTVLGDFVKLVYFATEVRFARKRLLSSARRHLTPLLAVQHAQQAALADRDQQGDHAQRGDGHSDDAH